MKMAIRGSLTRSRMRTTKSLVH